MLNRPAAKHAEFEVKAARRRWNPALHPRDSKGRFIETGGTVRLWGGKLARVVRALPNDRILVQDQTGPNEFNGRRHTTSAKWVSMVARPDGSAPTDNESKVQEEDEKRHNDPRRGNGVVRDDDGDPDTPNDPHDADDRGRPIGEDDDPVGPREDDDQDEPADGKLPVNVQALPNRSNGPGRFRDTAAVRQHFLDLADRPGQKPQMAQFLRSVAGEDDHLEVTNNGRLIALRDDSTGRWYLTATGTGQRMDAAGDFATLDEARKFARQLNTNTGGAAVTNGGFDFSDPDLDQAASTWRSPTGENIQATIKRTRQEFDRSQPAAPKTSSARMASPRDLKPGDRVKVTLSASDIEWPASTRDQQKPETVTVEGTVAPTYDADSSRWAALLDATLTSPRGTVLASGDSVRITRAPEQYAVTGQAEGFAPEKMRADRVRVGDIVAGGEFGHVVTDIRRYPGGRTFTTRNLGGRGELQQFGAAPGDTMDVIPRARRRPEDVQRDGLSRTQQHPNSSDAKRAAAAILKDWADVEERAAQQWPDGAPDEFRALAQHMKNVTDSPKGADGYHQNAQAMHGALAALDELDTEGLDQGMQRALQQLEGRLDDNADRFEADSRAITENKRKREAANAPQPDAPTANTPDQVPPAEPLRHNWDDPEGLVTLTMPEALADFLNVEETAAMEDPDTRKALTEATRGRNGTLKVTAPIETHRALLEWAWTLAGGEGLESVPKDVRAYNSYTKRVDVAAAKLQRAREEQSSDAPNADVRDANGDPQHVPGQVTLTPDEVNAPAAAAHAAKAPSAMDDGEIRDEIVSLMEREMANGGELSGVDRTRLRVLEAEEARRAGRKPPEEPKPKPKTPAEEAGGLFDVEPEQQQRFVADPNNPDDQADDAFGTPDMFAAAEGRDTSRLRPPQSRKPADFQVGDRFVDNNGRTHTVKEAPIRTPRGRIRVVDEEGAEHFLAPDKELRVLHPDEEAREVPEAATPDTNTPEGDAPSAGTPGGGTPAADALDAGASTPDTAGTADVDAPSVTEPAAAPDDQVRIDHTGTGTTVRFPTPNGMVSDEEFAVLRRLGFKGSRDRTQPRFFYLPSNMTLSRREDKVRQLKQWLDRRGVAYQAPGDEGEKPELSEEQLAQLQGRYSAPAGTWAVTDFRPGDEVWTGYRWETVDSIGPKNLRLQGRGSTPYDSVLARRRDGEIRTMFDEPADDGTPRPGTTDPNLMRDEAIQAELDHLRGATLPEGNEPAARTVRRQVSARIRALASAQSERSFARRRDEMNRRDQASLVRDPARLARLKGEQVQGRDGAPIGAVYKDPKGKWVFVDRDGRTPTKERYTSRAAAITALNKHTDARNQRAGEGWKHSAWDDVQPGDTIRVPELARLEGARARTVTGWSEPFEVSEIRRDDMGQVLINGRRGDEDVQLEVPRTDATFGASKPGTVPERNRGEGGGGMDWRQMRPDDFGQDERPAPAADQNAPRPTDEFGTPDIVDNGEALDAGGQDETTVARKLRDQLPELPELPPDPGGHVRHMAKRERLLQIRRPYEHAVASLDGILSGNPPTGDSREDLRRARKRIAETAQALDRYADDLPNPEQARAVHAELQNMDAAIDQAMAALPERAPRPQGEGPNGGTLYHPWDLQEGDLVTFQGTEPMGREVRTFRGIFNGQGMGSAKDHETGETSIRFEEAQWNADTQQWEGDGLVHYGQLVPQGLVEKFTPEQWDAGQGARDTADNATAPAAPIREMSPADMTDDDIKAELEELQAWQDRHVSLTGEGPRIQGSAMAALSPVASRRGELHEAQRRRELARKDREKREKEKQERAAALARAEIGKRNDDGSYPVNVDGEDAGTVSQLARKWRYTSADGQESPDSYPSRAEAVAALVRNRDTRRENADEDARREQARSEAPEGWTLGNREDVAENDIIRVPITRQDGNGRPYPVGWRQPVRVNSVSRNDNGTMVLSVSNLDGSRSDISPVFLNHPDDTFAWAKDRARPEPTPAWRHELRARMADIGDDVAVLQNREGLQDPERIQRLQDLIQRVSRGETDDLQGDLRQIRDEAAWLESQFDDPDLELPYETRRSKSWATAARMKAERDLRYPDFQNTGGTNGPDHAPDSPNAPLDPDDEFAAVRERYDGDMVPASEVELGDWVHTVSADPVYNEPMHMVGRVINVTPVLSNGQRRIEVETHLTLNGKDTVRTEFAMIRATDLVERLPEGNPGREDSSDLTRRLESERERHHASKVPVPAGWQAVDGSQIQPRPGDRFRIVARKGGGTGPNGGREHMNVTVEGPSESRDGYWRVKGQPMAFHPRDIVAVPDDADTSHRDGDGPDTDAPRSDTDDRASRAQGPANDSTGTPDDGDNQRQDEQDQDQTPGQDEAEQRQDDEENRRRRRDTAADGDAADPDGDPDGGNAGAPSDPGNGNNSNDDGSDEDANDPENENDPEAEDEERRRRRRRRRNRREGDGGPGNGGPGGPGLPHLNLPDFNTTDGAADGDGDGGDSDPVGRSRRPHVRHRDVDSLRNAWRTGDGLTPAEDTPERRTLLSALADREGLTLSPEGGLATYPEPQDDGSTVWRFVQARNGTNLPGITLASSIPEEARALAGRFEEITDRNGDPFDWDMEAGRTASVAAWRDGEGRNLPQALRAVQDDYEQERAGAFTLPEDLSTLSDSDLEAAALSGLGPDDMLRVMAEMDARDGYVDERIRTTVPETPPTTPEEAEREGRLMDEALRFGDTDITQPAPATPGRLRREFDALDDERFQAAMQATGGRMLSAEAEAQGIDPRVVFSGNKYSNKRAKDLASPELNHWFDGDDETPGNGRLTYPQYRQRENDRAIRAEFADWDEARYRQAVDFTNGYLFRREYKFGSADFDERELFSGGSLSARDRWRQYASEELQEWFDLNGGRQTFAQYKASRRDNDRAAREEYEEEQRRTQAEAEEAEQAPDTVASGERSDGGQLLIDGRDIVLPGTGQRLFHSMRWDPEQAREVARILESITDADGSPFPWGANDVAERARTFRTANGNTVFGEAAERLNGFDNVYEAWNSDLGQALHQRTWSREEAEWHERENQAGYTIPVDPADLRPGDEVSVPVATSRGQNTRPQDEYIGTVHATVTGEAHPFQRRSQFTDVGNPTIYTYPAEGFWTNQYGDQVDVTEVFPNLGTARRRPRPDELTATGGSTQDRAPRPGPRGPETIAEEPPRVEPEGEPEPVGGQPAHWARVEDLLPGDMVRMNGTTKGGRPVQRAGYVHATPVLIDVTRRGRTEQMWRTWITENPDGTGASGNVYTSANASAARAEAPDDVVPGSPASGAQAALRSGDLPNQIPVDRDGRGLFPGSTVTGSGDREGTVTGATDTTVSVHWSDGDDDAALSPTTLSVTDGQRPDGWTADGHRVTTQNIVSDMDGGLLGPVDDVDGDNVTIITATGTINRSAGDLLVTGEVRDDAPDTAPVTGIDEPAAAELKDGDVIVLDLDGHLATVAITSPPSRDGDRVTLQYADTTTGEIGEIDVDARAVLPRAQGPDGDAPDLGPDDAPEPNDDLTVHPTPHPVDPVTGPTVDPDLDSSDRNVIGDHADGPEDNPDAHQAAVRITADLPVTPEQAAALATQLRAAADPTTLEGRAALRAADHLDRSTGRTPPAGLDRPRPSNAAQIGEGDLVAMPDERHGDQVRAFRVIDVEDGPGGVRSFLLEDQEDQQWRRRIAHGAMPVWQLPEAEPEPVTPPDVDDADPVTTPTAPATPGPANTPDEPTAPIAQVRPGSLRVGDVIDAPVSRTGYQFNGHRRLTIISEPQRNGWWMQLTGVDEDGNVHDFGLHSGRAVNIYDRNRPTPALPPTGAPRDPNQVAQDDVDRIASDHARTLAARIIDQAVAGTEPHGDIHALREQIAQRLTAEALADARRNVRRDGSAALDAAGLTGRDRVAAHRRLRDARDQVHTDTVRAALRTINDLEPLDGESNEDLAARARDLLRLIPDQVASRPSATDTDADPDVINAVTGHADDAVNALLQQLQAAGVDPGDAERLARILTQQLSGSRQATARRIAARVAAANPDAGRQPGLLARIVALLIQMAKRLAELVKAGARKIAEKYRNSRERLRRLRAFLGRMVRRVRQWPESRRLARLHRAVNLPDADGDSLAARISHWAGLMPEPGRFGQAQRRVTFWRPTTWGQLAAGRLPDRSDRIQWAPDRAADGGPGLTTLRHMAALRAAGNDVDQDVTRRLSAALGDDFGDDPHATLQHADDYVASSERRLVNLQAARSGATIPDDDDLEVEITAARSELAAARREYADLRARYAAAVPDAVAAALGDVRDMGPAGANALVFGPDTDTDAERAVRGVQRLIPRAWLNAPEARRLTAVNGDQGRYEPEGQRITVADLADEGMGTAGHALAQHFARHLGDLDAAQRAFWFGRTHTGRPGARRMRRSALDRLLRRQQTQPETGDTLARSIQAMFSGDWYQDDDLRAFLLGLMATR
ncbi:hypothetical protein ACWEGS_28405 [Streptomyces sp. NPDC004822]